MRKVLLILFILTGLSCSSSDDLKEEEVIVAIEDEESNNENENEEPDASNENEEPFEFIQFYMINTVNDNLLISFNKSRIFLDNSETITNKIGGIYYTGIDPAAGFPYAFSQLVLDEVTYDENRVIVEKLSNDPALDIPVFKRTFILDGNNDIVQKIIETSDPVETDTLDFDYDLNGKISKIVSRKLTTPKESSFYFNINDNLDSIVTIEYDEETDTTIKILEKFEDYDSAKNPVKYFFMFEELFYRSLTKNNFSFYSLITITSRPGRIQSTSTYGEWDFKYDSEGNIIFDEL